MAANVDALDDLIRAAKFDERGLMVAIAQDAATGVVRMQAWANAEGVGALLAAGWPKILGKIAEESRELAEALPGDDKAHTAHEAADLLFHAMVGLEAAGVPVDAVFAELRRRFGTSGLEEKARRLKDT